MVDFSNLLLLTSRSSAYAKSSSGSASACANTDGWSGNCNGISSTSTETTTTTSSTDDGKDIGTKKYSIIVGGQMHSMVIDEGGSVWDYNETASTWTERSGDDVLTFDSKGANFVNNQVDMNSVSTDSVIVTQRDSISKYNLASGSTLEKYHFITSTSKPDIDNNPSQYNVAIIDNFSDTSDSEIAGTDVTHGDLVRALISGNVDTDTSISNSLNYDLGTDFTYANILSKLNSIEASVKNGTDIDAVNLSLGAAQIIDALGVSGLTLADLGTDDGKAKALAALSASGNTDLVNVINKISEMSKNGIEFYIASGNDADDTYATDDTSTIYAIAGDATSVCKSSDSAYSSYKAADTNNDGVITSDELYKYYTTGSGGEKDSDNDGQITDADFYNNDYKSYDENGDGYVTGGELGVFNALTLASGSNVHVIGATSSTGINSTTKDGIANYTDMNGTVDACVDGDVQITNLGKQSNGKYGYDVNGDGKVDIYSSYDDNIGLNSNYTYLGYDSTTGLYEFEDSNGYLVYSKTSDGRSQLTDGTSFAAPKAAKKHDTGLA